jgi:hypothetical protein
MRKHLKWIFLALVAMTFSGLVALPANAAESTAVPARAQPNDQVQSTTSLYRLWSPDAGDHFYTTDWAEAVRAFNYLGYRYERIEARVDAVNDGGTVPLYRLWSPDAGDHFYTTDWAEAVRAFNYLGYRYEGIQAYVWPSNVSGTTPLYRLWSPDAGDHFYTTDWAEAVRAFNYLGYRYEGIQAYVLPA